MLISHQAHPWKHHFFKLASGVGDDRFLQTQRGLKRSRRHQEQIPNLHRVIIRQVTMWWTRDLSVHIIKFPENTPLTRRFRDLPFRNSFAESMRPHANILISLVPSSRKVTILVWDNNVVRYDLVDDLLSWYRWKFPFPFFLERFRNFLSLSPQDYVAHISIVHFELTGRTTKWEINATGCQGMIFWMHYIPKCRDWLKVLLMTRWYFRWEAGGRNFVIHGVKNHIYNVVKKVFR